MKDIANFLKPILISPFVLYVFDKMAIVINICIPINIITVLIVGVLEIPGLLMLIVIDLLFF